MDLPGSGSLIQLDTSDIEFSSKDVNVDVGVEGEPIIQVVANVTLLSSYTSSISNFCSLLKAMFGYIH